MSLYSLLNDIFNMNSFPKPIAEKNVTPGPRFTVPYVPPYPLEDDFYTLTREEWTGALPPHSVTLSFVLPYSDWCEFEKSDLYQDLDKYLQALRKRGNQSEHVSTQD